VAAAVKCGETLLEAREMVPKGQFDAWLRANVSLKRNTAYSYMRLARHKDRVLLGDFETITDAIAGLVGFAAPTSNRLSDDQKAEMVRMATEDGLTLEQIAEAFDVSVSTVWYWSSDKNRTMRGTQRRRTLARRKAAERLLEREEKGKAVIKAGGPTGEAYSLIRKATQMLDRAISEVNDDRHVHRCLTSALTRLYNAEDDLVQAMGHEHGAAKRNGRKAA